MRKQKQNKTKKSISQNNQKKKESKEITNLSDAEFKAVVISVLKEFIEYGYKIKEEMKVTLSEIKKNPQGKNSEGKEAGIQTNNLEHKKEI